MAMSAVVVTSAKSLISKLLFLSSSIATLKTPHPLFPITAATTAAYGTLRNKSTSVTQKQKRRAELLLKRRTRSERELDEEGFENKYGNDTSAHVPVMLGEVLDVFASVPLKSFVDCTIGAGGHSAAIIEAHPEMELYVGLDVDPIAHEIARTRINGVLEKNSGCSRADLRVHSLLKNFKETNAVLQEIAGNPSGVQGILMDLGMSSMQVNNAERGFSVLSDGPLDMRMNPQASLKAEDILNLWPDVEVGRILRDYGEESNWLSLQKKIVGARSTGGIHSTCELVDLIRRSTSWTRGGRQGWIKTSTRVFQALRIAVNDELNTLKDSIHTCFDRLDSGGRLAVITFHSLEDRIVKQSFLDVINRGTGAVGKNKKEKEAWVKQMVHGPNGVVLTKRPITPSGSEERLNPRSRSAKLRVIEKV